MEGPLEDRRDPQMIEPWRKREREGEERNGRRLAMATGGPEFSLLFLFLFFSSLFVYFDSSRDPVEGIV